MDREREREGGMEKDTECRRDNVSIDALDRARES